MQILSDSSNSVFFMRAGAWDISQITNVYSPTGRSEFYRSSAHENTASCDLPNQIATRNASGSCDTSLKIATDSKDARPQGGLEQGSGSKALHRSLRGGRPARRRRCPRGCHVFFSVGSADDQKQGALFCISARENYVTPRALLAHL